MDEDYYSDEEWYDDQVAAATDYYSDEDWAADQTAGLEDLGDGNWRDPSDGSVYLSDTGEWVFPEENFVDPASGTEIQSDGTLVFANGDQLNTDGSVIFADGSVLQTSEDGLTTYRDADGVVWERMDDAGAPNLWQNTQNGDVFNENDETLQKATQVTGGYAQPVATGSSRPSSSGSSGGGGGGSGAGMSLGGSAKTPSLNDLLKTLGGVLGAQQQLATAKTNGANPAQLAALQSQLAAAARSAAPTVTGTGGINQFLKDNATVLIVAGIGAAALLMIANRRPSYDQRAA